MHAVGGCCQSAPALSLPRSCADRGQINAREYQRRTGQVEEVQLLAEKRHRERDAEQRNQVEEQCGPIRADLLHRAVPEQIAENRRKDGKIIMPPMDAAFHTAIRPLAASIR